MYFVSVLLFCMLFSAVGVSCHPSPFLGAVGLLVCVLFGCGYLVSIGGNFIGIILLLVYLGGVLVVYAYSIALACDKYVEAWGARSVFWYCLSYVLFVMFVWCVVGSDTILMVGTVDSVLGVSLLYFCGGGFLFFCGFGLLLALFSVLELVRGGIRGGLRMV